MNSNTNEKLLDISFQDSLTGYCTGNNGVILKSSDGGLTWNTIHSRQGLVLSEIECSPTGNVMALGRRNSALFVVYSQDGGVTWQYDSTSFQVPNNQYNLRSADSAFLFQADASHIVEWEFTGNTNTVYTNSLAFDIYNDSVINVLTDDYESIVKIDYKNALLIGNTSSNMSFFNNNQIFFAVNFINDSLGFLTYTYNPSVFQTLDGGNTWWQRYDNDSTLDLYFDADNCARLFDSVYLAASWNVAGTINISVDNGANWYNLQIDSVNFLFGMTSVGETAFVCGDNGVIYKIDAGNVLGWKSADRAMTLYQIYPNPSSGKIHIEVSEKLNIKKIYILSMDGNIVKKFNGSNLSLNLDNMPTGQYIVQIVTRDGEVLNKRIVLTD